MTSVKFDEANVALAENQPEYETLHIHYDVEDVEGKMTACFKLTDEEIAEIVATKKIWHTQLTFGNNFQPIYMTTKNPFN